MSISSSTWREGLLIPVSIRRCQLCVRRSVGFVSSRTGQDVLEADVESRVSVSGKGVAVLASNIARSGVVVSNGILDLLVA